MKRIRLLAGPLVLGALLAAGSAGAGPFAPPGDTALRHDLQRLNDAGLIDLPLTTWPLSWRDIDGRLADVGPGDLPPSVAAAYLRVKERSRQETAGASGYRLSVSAAGNPRAVRGFEEVPREEGAVTAGLSWLGERLAINLNAQVVADPSDEDEFRPDGTWVGLSLGNWLLSAGWQERWWGPGRDGSLILSSNARPAPGIAIQRDQSAAFESRWLRWIGPWSLSAFMNRLDDERAVDDALLFGLRLSFRPLDSLEIGLSRTAQWCGDDRPCDLGAFGDLLLGNDNRGVNVDPEEEPGNQLAGIDIRWSLPGDTPLALYMQWIGEDTRQGGPQPGSWLRQVGIEHWGDAFGLEHRTHLEMADTTCREGGFGFADAKPDCGYEHGIYRTGYRYRGRVMAYPTDGDGRTWSVGSTLLQPAGHSWNFSLRYMELNRAGAPDVRHSLTATPQDLADIQVTHERLSDYGRFHVGLGMSWLDDAVSNDSTTEVTAFLQWSLE